MQHGHSDAFVNVHAFSTHSMPGAPLPFEDALVGGPLTPDLQPLQAPAGSLPSMQLSESYGQVSMHLTLKFCDSLKMQVCEQTEQSRDVSSQRPYPLRCA